MTYKNDLEQGSLSKKQFFVNVYFYTVFKLLILVVGYGFLKQIVYLKFITIIDSTLSFLGTYRITSVFGQEVKDILKTVADSFYIRGQTGGYDIDWYFLAFYTSTLRKRSTEKERKYHFYNTIVLNSAQFLGTFLYYDFLKKSTSTPVSVVFLGLLLIPEQILTMSTNGILWTVTTLIYLLLAKPYVTLLNPGFNIEITKGFMPLNYLNTSVSSLSVFFVPFLIYFLKTKFLNLTILLGVSSFVYNFFNLSATTLEGFQTYTVFNFFNFLFSNISTFSKNFVLIEFNYLLLVLFLKSYVNFRTYLKNKVKVEEDYNKNYKESEVTGLRNPIFFVLLFNSIVFFVSYVFLPPYSQLIIRFLACFTQNYTTLLYTFLLCIFAFLMGVLFVVVETITIDLFLGFYQKITKKTITKEINSELAKSRVATIYILIGYDSTSFNSIIISSFKALGIAAIALIFGYLLNVLKELKEKKDRELIEKGIIIRS